MRRLILADVKSVNRNGCSSGHYFSLANNYKSLYEDFCEVKIAGGPVYKTLLKEEDLYLLPYDCLVNSEPKWRQVWHTLQNCRYLFQQTSKDDVIIMQHSAAATFMIGIVLYVRKAKNIYIIAYDTKSISSCFKRIVYRFAQRHIKGFLCSNERVAQAFRKPYIIIPDYIYAGSVKSLEHVSSYTEKKIDFLIVGSIWPDKGVVEAAKFLANTPCRVLIAGAPSNENLKRDLLSVCSGVENIELRLGFVSERDYERYMAETRYCLLNYQGTYSERSSGVVLDALFKGVPVVGHSSHALSLVENKNMGFVYTDISELALEKVLNEQVYNQYRNNVISYLKRNHEYRDRVLTFCMLK